MPGVELFSLSAETVESSAGFDCVIGGVIDGGSAAASVPWLECVGKGESSQRAAAGEVEVSVSCGILADVDVGFDCVDGAA